MAATRNRGRAEPAPKARNDAYVGLLAVALLALVGGSALLYAEYDGYGSQPPQPAPNLAPAGGTE